MVTSINDNNNNDIDCFSEFVFLFSFLCDINLLFLVIFYRMIFSNKLPLFRFNLTVESESTLLSADKYSLFKSLISHFYQKKEMSNMNQRPVMERTQDSISMSFVSANVDELDPCFMYIQILKEILSSFEFEQDPTEKDYYLHTALWWYTSSSSLCSTVNRALRMMDVSLMIRLGYFIRDLLKNIDEIYLNKINEWKSLGLFKVYRGQGILLKDFDQLKNSKGGLLAFNNFLSTSRNRSIAIFFADSNEINSESTRVLFEITVDPSISNVSFIDLQSISQYSHEEEILFSMQSIFRIGDIQFDEDNHLWQVNLKLTSDNDPQLQTLTEFVRNETFPQKKGWYRLGEVLYKLGQFDKAQQVCRVMFEQTNNPCELANIYHLLAMIKDSQEKYKQAIKFYKKSLRINRENLSSTHIDVGASYTSLGLVYSKLGKLRKALRAHERALQICTPDSPSKISICCNNIGLVHEERHDYIQAQHSYEQALELQQKHLPEHHPVLGISYGNLGKIQNLIGDHAEALASHEKALHIFQRSLPPNHPYLGITYNNLALVYEKLTDYSQALFYYQKALEIDQSSSLGTTLTNIGVIYFRMNDHQQALSYYNKALTIFKKTLPTTNHPHFAALLNNISKLNCSEKFFE